MGARDVPLSKPRKMQELSRLPRFPFRQVGGVLPRARLGLRQSVKVGAAPVSEALACEAAASGASAGHRPPNAPPRSGIPRLGCVACLACLACLAFSRMSRVAAARWLGRGAQRPPVGVPSGTSTGVSTGRREFRRESENRNTFPEIGYSDLAPVGRVCAAPDAAPEVTLPVLPRSSA